MYNEHQFKAELTDLFHKRLEIEILTNNIVFIDDVRKWIQWTKELERHGETSVMRDLGEDYSLKKVIQRMKEAGMDSYDMKKMLVDIVGREVDIDNSC